MRNGPNLNGVTRQGWRIPLLFERLMDHRFPPVTRIGITSIASTALSSPALADETAAKLAWILLS